MAFSKLFSKRKPSDKQKLLYEESMPAAVKQVAWDSGRHQALQRPMVKPKEKSE